MKKLKIASVSILLLIVGLGVSSYGTGDTNPESHKKPEIVPYHIHDCGDPGCTSYDQDNLYLCPNCSTCRMGLDK